MKHGFLKSRRRRVTPTWMRAPVVHGIVTAGLALLLGAAAGPAHAELLRTGGTGAAMQMLQRLGAAFTAREPATTLEVMPSLGSSGGIAAVADGVLNFSVSGRPLKSEEAKSLDATLLASTPFGLASSQPDPGNIASADIAAFYQALTSAWPDGTPVRVVLRPRSEVDSTLLAKMFPKLEGVIEELRQRKEIPLAVTDQDNVAMAEKIPGSIAAVTLTQILTEKPNLHFVAIDGITPTLENFERGAYPYRKDFYLVVPHRMTPAAERFIAFVRSADGERVLRETGNLVPRP
jgi:phosphate transport system substrate-binding protein